MKIRRLEVDDVDKGYCDLLSQLTNAPLLTKDTFKKIFYKCQSDIFVIETKQKIIASGSLFIEYKFIRGGGLVGHMEDIIIDKNYRGYKLGNQIVNHLILYAKDKGCYKIIANCSEDILPFYKKCNFEKKGVQISIYF